MVGSRLRAFSLLLIVLALLASGCDVFFPPQPTKVPPDSTPDATAATVTPTVATPEPTPTLAGPRLMWVWVPPQFNPEDDSQEARLFKARLAAFEVENPDVHIVVRVKAASGPGGLLEALAATRAAAPSAVPSLVILPRADLETAALKGMIFPLDNLTDTLDEADWYTYARQLGQVYGGSYGVPFAGDALLLVYRPSVVQPRPRTWEELLELEEPMLFPAADPLASLILNLYLSAGGAVENAQRQPILEVEELIQALQVIADGVRLKILTATLADYQTDTQVWQAFREVKANLAVTWSSRYLGDLPVDASAMLLPSLNKTEISLARGWVWAVTDLDEQGRRLAIRLVEYLTKSDYLTDWTYAAGYLPVRPSTLAGWPNPSMRVLLSQLALSAQVRPPNEILNSIAPALTEATLLVLRQQSDPLQAAQKAADRLTPPETP